MSDENLDPEDIRDADESDFGSGSVHATREYVGQKIAEESVARAGACDALQRSVQTVDTRLSQHVGDGTHVTSAEKENWNGKAPLENGKIPAALLPSYVDDVLEFASESAFPRPGESGKIYIATDTNKQYRWSGTQYAEISSSLALGETAQSAYPGDKGKKNAADISALKTGKQDAISGEQLAALNSGATKEKIDSIENKAEESLGWVDATGRFRFTGQPEYDELTSIWSWVDEDGVLWEGYGNSDSTIVEMRPETGEGRMLAVRKRVLRTGDELFVYGNSVLCGSLVLENPPGIAGGGLAIVLKGGSGNIALSVSDGLGLTTSIKKDGKEVATEEQVKAVSNKVEDIKSTVSTDNRFLVGGSYSEAPEEGSPTTAAIQTHDAETDKWTDNIRIDKAYDAVKLADDSTETVSLDKSVQTVRTHAANLVISIPQSIEGTVRDFCIYIFNQNAQGGTETAITASDSISVFQDENDSVKWNTACPAGGQIAVYLTAIPDASGKVFRAARSVLKRAEDIT